MRMFIALISHRRCLRTRNVRTPTWIYFNPVHSISLSFEPNLLMQGIQTGSRGSPRCTSVFYHRARARTYTHTYKHYASACMQRKTFFLKPSKPETLVLNMRHIFSQFFNLQPFSNSSSPSLSSHFVQQSDNYI